MQQGGAACLFIELPGPPTRCAPAAPPLPRRPSFPRSASEPALQGDYSELLASSTFCLVLQGDGWSARMDDAVLHGCIPVVIIDEVYVSFETVVDFSRIGLRVNSTDLERLPDILLAVDAERRQEMQRNLAQVWQK